MKRCWPAGQAAEESLSCCTSPWGPLTAALWMYIKTKQNKKNFADCQSSCRNVRRRVLWLCGGFSHAGTSSLSLGCRHTELRRLSSAFCPPCPFNMWSSESDYATAPVLVSFPCFPGSSSHSSPWRFHIPSAGKAPQTFGPATVKRLNLASLGFVRFPCQLS